MPEPDPTLPAHIEDAVKSIADLHVQHHTEATPLERMVERAVRLVGRPQFIGFLTAVVAVWIVSNLGLLAIGHKAFDPPPFQILQDVGTLLALYITVLILIAQQREKKISEHVEHLTLQLSILTEMKTAKLIQLIEEIRHDSPTLHNREDPSAAELAVPADTRVILDALKDTTQEALAVVKEGETGGGIF